MGRFLVWGWVVVVGLLWSGVATAEDLEEKRPPVVVPEPDLGSDLWEMAEHSGRAVAYQFTSWDTWAAMAAGAGITALLTLDDIDQQEAVEDAQILGKTGRKIGDVGGLILNVPVLPLGAYTLGRATGDAKMRAFGLELGALQLILSAEVILVSQIPFHKRPIIRRGDLDESDQEAANRFFRGQSSYPSGHMIGVTALMYESWMWYGWEMGVPATLATIFVGLARVEEGQHYVTDVVGSVMLGGVTALAISQTRSAWMTEVMDGEALVMPWISPTGSVGVAGVF